MKKRILSWGLVLCLALSLLPVPAQAAGTTHSHSGWTPLTGNSIQINGGGKFYLDADITATSVISVTTGDVTLCLNGHVLNLNGNNIAVSGGSLTICDCNAQTPHCFAKNSDGLWELDENGSETIFGGVITGGQAKNGGAVIMTGGALTLESGSIAGSSADKGGGVYASGGVFTMTGGAIIGNLANGKGNSYDNFCGGGGVYLDNSGMFTMTGGSIENNTAIVNAQNDGGGGVLIANGSSFTMSDSAIISGNAAAQGTGVSVGGGVYLWVGSFTMQGGMVSGNEAGAGAGVYVFGTNIGESGDQTTKADFCLSGGSITGNHATLSNYGGGVAVASAITYKAKFRLSGSPVISGNTAGSDRAASNISLQDNQITLESPIPEGQNYGVGIGGTSMWVTSGWTTYMAGEDPNQYFTSETEGAIVLLYGDAGSQEVILHTHSYSCTADASAGAIKQTCMPCQHEAIASLVIDEGPHYATGSEVRPARVEYTGDDWQGTEPVITYDNNIVVGTATAKLTIGSCTVSRSFEIVQRQYTVSFNTNGHGGQAPADQTVTEGGRVSDPGALSAAGYVFGGWYPNAACTGEAWDFGSKTVGEDLTLYAKWTAIAADTPEVQTGADVSQTYGTAGGSIAVTVPAIEGHTLRYQWYKSADGQNTGGTKIDGAVGSAYSIPETLDVGTYSYYCVVTAERQDNGQQTAVFSDVMTVTIEKARYPEPAEGEGYTIDYKSETIAILSGYEVYTAPDGVKVESGSITDFLGETLYIRKQGDSNHYLSDWTAFSVASRPAAPGGAVSVTGETVQGSGDGSVQIPDGMQYHTGDGVWVSGPATVEDLRAGDKIVVRVEATQSYPHGIEQTYTVPESTGTLTVTFDAAGGSTVPPVTGLTYNETITEPAQPTRDGYDFNGWYQDGTAFDFDTPITENLLLTARWTLQKPRVTLRADAVSAIYGDTITLTAEPVHEAKGLEYSYLWQKDGAPLAQTGAVLQCTQVADTGSYTVEVTVKDQQGQTAAETSSPQEITIEQANPVVVWPTAAAITYGQSLADSIFTGGETAAGICAWQRGDIRPAVADSGVTRYAVTFTPDDTQNYKTVQGEVTIVVNKAPLTPSIASVADKVYDGSLDTTGTLEISGAIGSEKPAVTGVFAFTDANAGENKAVNVTDITLTGNWGENYTLLTQTLSDQATAAKITPRTVELDWGNTQSVVYSGTPAGITATAIGLLEGESCLVQVEGGDAVRTGSYTARADSLSNPNYALPKEGLTWSYSITPKPIYVTWTGLRQTYGALETVQALPAGVVSEDTVTAEVSGGKTDAGTYTVSATLTGADAQQYTLKNSTAELTVAPKTVIFAVLSSAAQADGSAKAAVLSVDDSACAYTVAYKQDGKTVAAPADTGSYEIWVTITDKNYCHSDGSDSMQVGVFTITQAPPVLYTASFTGGEGATGDAPAAQQALSGGSISLPANPFAKEGHYLFAGWLAEGDSRIYQQGDSFTMPAQDVTFTAQWQPVFTISGTINEKYEEDSDAERPAEKAVVSLWLGANKINEAVADNYGQFTFENLIPGTYNLVITKDVRIVTRKVQIVNENQNCDAVLPKGATNSVVEVAHGSPNVVVGNLDLIFEQIDEKIFTTADAQTVKDGGKVEITFYAEEKQQQDSAVATDMTQIAAAKDDAVTLGLVMNYTLKKEVFDADGDPNLSASKTIPQSNVLLEVLLPLPDDLQEKGSYFVYRVHSSTGQDADKQVQQLWQGEENANNLGEYFTVSGDKTSLTLHVKCFSTYAVGYTEQPSGGSGGGSSSGGATSQNYAPEVVPSENGAVTVTPQNPQKGEQVTITVQPDAGYVVDTVQVIGPDGQPVAVTPGTDGGFSFVQPDGAVTITVIFRMDAGAQDCPRDENCPMADFTDMDMHAWYHDGVHYCLDEGLMVGTGKATFAPNAAITRGMIVTILWRLEGRPVVNYLLRYDDVKQEDWYGEAVRWASGTDVAVGYGNGKFGPDDPITREQLAAMLWRYAGYPEVEGDLSAFTDGEQTSDWARTAMIWAVQKGLIAGVGNGRLDAQGQATRAQAAAILMRYASQIT